MMEGWWSMMSVIVDTETSSKTIGDRILRSLFVHFINPLRTVLGEFRHECPEMVPPLLG